MNGTTSSDKEPEPGDGSKFATAVWNGSHLLLVDDEDSFRRFMRRSLERAGYILHEAQNFDQAADILKRHAINAVLSDITMPGLGGLDLLRFINAEHPNIPLILITGNPSLESAAEALRQGAFDYVRKPCSKSDLIEAVGRAIEARSK